MPVPSNVPSLRACLGFVNHYAKFIPQLCNLRAPLERLLQKIVLFVWSNKCQESSQRIKRILKSPLSRTHLQSDKPLFLASDAFSVGVGAVLFHRFANGTKKVIANASKSLTLVKRNYSQIEREALSIIFGVKKFYQYLWGRELTLLTDHQPFTTIFDSKNGVPLLLASRLRRWVLFLMNYTNRIQYCPVATCDNFNNWETICSLQCPLVGTYSDRLILFLLTADDCGWQRSQDSLRTVLIWSIVDYLF